MCVTVAHALWVCVQYAAVRCCSWWQVSQCAGLLQRWQLACVDVGASTYLYIYMYLVVCILRRARYVLFAGGCTFCCMSFICRPM